MGSFLGELSSRITADSTGRSRLLRFWGKARGRRSRTFAMQCWFWLTCICTVLCFGCFDVLSVLCYAVALCCTVLCCVVLYFVVLRIAVLYCVLLFVFCCTVLLALLYVILHCL